MKVHSFPLRRWLIGLGVLALASAVPAAVYSKATPATKAHVAVKPVVVTVLAGKPSELAFKLSRYSRLPVGKPIEFKVTDAGLAFHDFKICTRPTTSFKANTCVGKVTKVLHPKQSATLTVTLKKVGKYEFLCTVTGHAASGMKGLLGVGVSVTAAQETAATPPLKTVTTTTTPAATTTAPVTTTPVATTTTAVPPPQPAADHSQDSSCPNGSTIKQTGAGADGDGDEAGDPTDGDGCL